MSGPKIDLRLTDVYRRGADELARYVLGHGGAARGAKALARALIAAHGRYAPENVSTAYGCELVELDLSIAIDEARAGKPVTDPGGDGRLVEPRLPIEEVSVLQAIECGFKIDWASGTRPEDELDFSLSAGARCGSPWLSFSAGPKDSRRYFRLHAKELIEAFLRRYDGEIEPATAEEEAGR